MNEQKEIQPLEALEKVGYADFFIGKNGTHATTLLKNTKYYAIIKIALENKQNIEGQIDRIFAKHNIKSFVELDQTLTAKKTFKYLIVSNYDSGWGWGVCDSGNCDNKDLKRATQELYYKTADREFKQLLVEYYGSAYDTIIYNENGEMEVLK